MDAKETVKEGLQARKETRAAEARAKKAEEKAAATRDEYFHERMNHMSCRQAWEQERESLLWSLEDRNAFIECLAKERDELIADAKEAKQTRLVLGIVKALVVFTASFVARDLQLVVAWLATGLMVATALYMGYASVKLLRKK